jgi:hypothetical protein
LRSVSYRLPLSAVFVNQLLDGRVLSVVTLDGTCKCPHDNRGGREVLPTARRQSGHPSAKVIAVALRAQEFEEGPSRHKKLPILVS